LRIILLLIIGFDSAETTGRELAALLDQPRRGLIDGSASSPTDDGLVRQAYLDRVERLGRFGSPQR
jgi:hypothetical protein